MTIILILSNYYFLTRVIYVLQTELSKTNLCIGVRCVIVVMREIAKIHSNFAV